MSRGPTGNPQRVDITDPVYRIQESRTFTNENWNANGRDIYVRSNVNDPRNLVPIVTVRFTNCKIYNLRSLVVGNSAIVYLDNCLIYGGVDETGRNDGTDLTDEDNIGYIEPGIFLVAIHKVGKLYINNSSVIATHNVTNARGQNGIAVYGECYVNGSLVKGGTGGTMHGYTLTEDAIDAVSNMRGANEELQESLTNFFTSTQVGMALSNTYDQAMSVHEEVMFYHDKAYDTITFQLGDRIDDLKSELNIPDREQLDGLISEGIRSLVSDNTIATVFELAAGYAVDRVLEEVDTRLIGPAKEAILSRASNVVSKIADKNKTVAKAVRLADKVSDGVSRGLAVFDNPMVSLAISAGTYFAEREQKRLMLFEDTIGESVTGDPVIDTIFTLMDPSELLFNIFMDKLVKIIENNTNHDNYVIRERKFDGVFRSGTNGPNGGLGGDAIRIFKEGTCEIVDSDIYGGNGGRGGNGGDGANGNYYKENPNTTYGIWGKLTPSVFGVNGDYRENNVKEIAFNTISFSINKDHYFNNATDALFGIINQNRYYSEFNILDIQASCQFLWREGESFSSQDNYDRNNPLPLFMGLRGPPAPYVGIRGGAGPDILTEMEPFYNLWVIDMDCVTGYPTYTYKRFQMNSSENSDPQERDQENIYKLLAPHGGRGGRGGDGGQGGIAIFNESSRFRLINSTMHHGLAGDAGLGGQRGFGTRARQFYVKTFADGAIGTGYKIKTIRIFYVNPGEDGLNGMDGVVGIDGLKILQPCGLATLEMPLFSFSELFSRHVLINDGLDIKSNDLLMKGSIASYIEKGPLNVFNPSQKIYGVRTVPIGRVRNPVITLSPSYVTNDIPFNIYPVISQNSIYTMGSRQFTRAQNDFIDMGPKELTLNNLGFTAIVRVKFTSVGRWERVFDLSEPSKNGIMMARKNLTNNLLITINSSESLDCQDAILPDVDTTYVMTYQPDIKKLQLRRVNDNKIYSMNITSLVPSNYRYPNCYIGRSNYPSDDLFGGFISYLVLLKRFVSSYEIDSIIRIGDQSLYTIRIPTSDYTLEIMPYGKRRVVIPSINLNDTYRGYYTGVVSASGEPFNLREVELTIPTAIKVQSFYILAMTANELPEVEARNVATGETQFVNMGLTNNYLLIRYVANITWPNDTNTLSFSTNMDIYDLYRTYIVVFDTLTGNDGDRCEITSIQFKGVPKSNVVNSFHGFINTYDSSIATLNNFTYRPTFQYGIYKNRQNPTINERNIELINCIATYNRSFIESVISRESIFHTTNTNIKDCHITGIYQNVIDNSNITGAKITNLRMMNNTNTIFTNCTIEEMTIENSTVRLIGCKIFLLKAINSVIYVQSHTFIGNRSEFLNSTVRVRDSPTLKPDISTRTTIIYENRYNRVINVEMPPVDYGLTEYFIAENFKKDGTEYKWMSAISDNVGTVNIRGTGERVKKDFFVRPNNHIHTLHAIQLIDDGIAHLERVNQWGEFISFSSNPIPTYINDLECPYYGDGYVNFVANQSLANYNTPIDFTKGITLQWSCAIRGISSSNRLIRINSIYPFDIFASNAMMRVIIVGIINGRPNSVEVNLPNSIIKDEWATWTFQLRVLNDTTIFASLSKETTNGTVTTVSNNYTLSYVKSTSISFILGALQSNYSLHSLFIKEGLLSSSDAQIYHSLIQTKNLMYVYGNVNVGLSFPCIPINNIYTLFWVARYNGNTRRQIFTTQPFALNSVNQPYDWSSGFKNGLAGVAYRNIPEVTDNWVTQNTTSTHGTNWVLGTDQYYLFRSNKIIRNKNPPLACGDFTNSPYLVVNTCNENSDWAVSCILYYNRILSDNEISDVEKYLSQLYNI
jgi:hypothetical protein